MDQNQRPQYYEGQYLGADDLAAIVRFARTTDARHALGAHTWGIGIGLELVERSLPGGDVEMTLTPGFAFDGAGRQLVALAPAKLGPELFDGFDDAVDPSGTSLEAWIVYHELSARHPGEGFASCREDAPFSRVIESYRIEIRRPPVNEYRGVTVAGRVLDAKAAVSAFKPGGASLYDETVAYQELPDQGDKPRWALFVGIARWVKPVNVAGRLLKRTDADLNATRRRRRYLGAVAETIAAPDGVLRLRDRRKDPDDNTLNYQPPVVKAPAGAPPDNDLVWVEGGMRVIGDARLVAGKLDWRVERGGDDSVPVWLRRVKDATTPAGKVTLEAALGPPALPNGQTRFAVSVLAPAGASTERFTVVTDGRVGVNTPDPTNALHVTGPTGIRHGPGYVSGDATWTGVSLHAYFKSGDKWQFPDPLRKAAAIRLEEASGVPVISMATNVFADPAKWDTRFVVRGDTGNVGIGTSAPGFKLDVNGDLHIVGDAHKDSAGLFWLASDRAHKEDIRPLANALSTLLRLRGVEFSWREPERHGVAPGRYSGFVAQDVEKVLPQWVKTTPAGHKVLNPIGIDALLVEAIRELDTRCRRLEAALEAKGESAAAKRAPRKSAKK